MPGLHFPSECHTAEDYERRGRSSGVGNDSGEADIVERLRVNMHAYGIAQEAADLIERLRAELADLRVAAQMVTQAHEDGDDLQGPIDLLTRVLDAAMKGD